MNKIFPILDHLYIFQNLEYEPIDFLKWFLRNPFARNLQKKHRLKFTPKALLLLGVSLLLSILTSALVIYLILGLPPGHWWSDITTLILFIILQIFSPIFLIFAWLILFPLETYQKIKIISAAKEKLKNLPNLKVIAITGSFAKTSTKDVLYTLLWKDFRVVKTPKSYNTQISIARTILSDLKTNTQIFLVEMDAYHPGEIKRLAEFVSPEIGIITSIAPQHLGRFGSMEKLAKTQFELAEVLPEDGLLVLNSESSEILKLAQNYQNTKSFYGKRAGDNLKAQNIRQTKEALGFELITPMGITQISLPLFGTHHIQNFLGAVAVAQNLGLSLKTIQQRAKWILPTPHRLEIKKQGSLTIIDNTYNTNPSVSRSSLKLLRDYPGDQKILITPGLVELGSEHSRENREFTKSAAEIADHIIIVGDNAQKDLLEGLERANFSKEKIHLAKSTQQALALLPQLTTSETVVLLENDLPDQYN